MFSEIPQLDVLNNLRALANRTEKCTDREPRFFSPWEPAGDGEVRVHGANGGAERERVLLIHHDLISAVYLKIYD